MIYKATRNIENLNKRIFQGVGPYDSPKIRAVKFEPCDFIGFNYAASTKERAEKGVHFFLDDYQFERVWNNAEKYLAMLSDFKYVMTPDFSTYTDYPKAIQIYNHYRKHWIGAYYQENGISVIPTISWSTPDSYEWCFDGEPIGGTVAVSSVGTQKSKKAKELFILGYKEMVRRLQPETIIFYGNVPEECTENIVRIKTFQDHFKEAKCYGR